MSLPLDKSTWEHVAFGDVVRNVNETMKDAAANGIDRVIAMEHLDPGELKIERWGDAAEGTTFTRRVRPGQTLFGKRRAYQRKVAYAEFDAICSGDIYTFEADGTRIHGDFLPFLVQSDPFFDHALDTSAGSLSPRTNWRDLANFEFALPPLDEQKRIAKLLWAAEHHRRQLRTCERDLVLTRVTWLHSLFESARADTGFIDLNTLIDEDRPICYGVLMPGPEYEGGPLIVDVKDFPDGRIRVDSVRRCDPAIESGFKRSRLRTGDVLLSIRGTIGRVAVVPEALDGQNISRDSARISGDPAKVDPEFLRLVLESPDVQEEIRRTTTGLAVKGINVARIRSLAVPDWPLERQRASVAAHAEIERSIEVDRAESQTLSTVRSSILAHIFGGN